MLSQIKVPQYQHDEGMWECPHKVTNSVMQSSGGVRGYGVYKNVNALICAYSVLLQGSRWAACRCCVSAKYHYISTMGECGSTHRK